MLALSALVVREEPPSELALLRHPDPRERWNAALNLGYRRERSAVPDLVAALRDPHPNVSCLAAWALGRLGDRTATPAMVEALGRALANPFVLTQLLVPSLGRLRDPRALPVLLDVVRTSPDSGDREQAVEAIARLPGMHVQEYLYQLAHDRDENVREAALRPPRRNVDLPVLPGEVLRLDAPDLRVANLGDYQPPEDAPIGMARAERRPLRELCDEAQRGPNPARGNAILFLGNRRGVDRTTAQVLIGFLEDPDPAIRWKAAKSLGKLRRTDAVPALLRAMDDPDKDVREDVAQALARMPGASSSDAIMTALEKAMDDSSPEVPLIVAHQAALLRGPRALRLLQGALDSPFPPVRLQARRSLQQSPVSAGLHRSL